MRKATTQPKPRPTNSNLQKRPSTPKQSDDDAATVKVMSVQAGNTGN